MPGYIASLVLVLYLIQWVYFFRAWKGLKVYQADGVPSTRVSVIIPYRNESHVITATINKVLSQEYPTELFEVICVDDGSTDQGPQLVESMKNDRTTLISLKVTHGFGKKAALTEGIRMARGELLITIDADVIVPPQWISFVANYYERERKEMIVLPLSFHEERSRFEKWQALEYLGLAGTSGAAASAGHPIMCSGANLAFSKAAFERVNGFEGNQTISSGDDMFFLFKLKKTNPFQIGYLHHTGVIGETRACRTVSEFVSQRVRWASKAGSYRDAETIVLAAIVWLANASVIVGWVDLFFGSGFPWTMVLVIVKMGVDLIFLRSVASFYGKTERLRGYPKLALIYPLYVVLIPLIGIFFRPIWKGRSISLGRNPISNDAR